jgi:hypothetical protein
MMKPSKTNWTLVVATLSALTGTVSIIDSVDAADEEQVVRPSGEITAADRQYWAYQPVRSPSVPPVKNDIWCHSPVDHFVLARLEANHFVPVEPAERRVLIRRATFDLTGLPPDPADVDHFVSDRSPDAYYRLLDRLLASPHGGPHIARRWLDVARYAEDVRPANFQHEKLPLAYLYRDWVIESFNADLPYDRFVTMQIAGDLLEQSGNDGLIALGFFTVGPVYGSDGGNKDSVIRAAAETLDDKVDVLSRGFLGLTVSCARCHDHKFDPIPIEDYYSLAGPLKNTEFGVEVPLVSESEVQVYKQAQEPIEALQERLKKARDQVADRQVIEQMEADLIRMQANAPAIYPRAYSVVDQDNQDMSVALRGNPQNPGSLVPRRMLRILAGDNPVAFTQGSGRLELAHAVANADNPLTSRVMANRIWQQHFGQGIVTTPDNFGRLGARPTHPELIDWLAHEFVEGDWSVKRLHREIMSSATYCLSSRIDKHNGQLDGDNKFLWRMNRRRLDVESWRDAVLSVAGTLDTSLETPANGDLLTNDRRTIFSHLSRHSKTASDKFLRTFDFPDANISNSQRVVTTVPQQQLFVMNDQFMVDQARAFAQRISDISENVDQRIDEAFMLAYGRQPANVERTFIRQFLSNDAQENTVFSKWEQIAQVILASNEFMYLE